MAVPGFTTLNGPVATDAADGATSYNAIAQRADSNFPKFNTWTTLATDAAIPRTTFIGSTVFAFASGWAWEGYSGREIWGKKWGGVTYVSLAVKRTGATIPKGTGGNLTDTLIGTLAVGWRPPWTHYASVPCGAGAFQTYTLTSGAVYLYAASDLFDFRSGQVLLWSMLWPNWDATPF